MAALPERHICGSLLCFPIPERKSLRDDEVLQNLLAGATVTIYFRDLGPQIGWTKVRNTHRFYRNKSHFPPYLYCKIRI